MAKGDSSDLRTKEAKALKKAYEEAAKDLGKELTKQIKKANRSGASDFRKQFLDQAKSANELVQKNYIKLQQKGLGDLAKEYTTALQGVQSGALSTAEFKIISDSFQTEMEKKTPKIGEALKSSISGAFSHIGVLIGPGSIKTTSISCIKSSLLSASVKPSRACFEAV